MSSVTLNFDGDKFTWNIFLEYPPGPLPANFTEDLDAAQQALLGKFKAAPGEGSDEFALSVSGTGKDAFSAKSHSMDTVMKMASEFYKGEDATWRKKQQ